MSIAKFIRMALGRVRCWFLQHEPNRRKVHKRPGGQHYSYCRHCGRQIRRRGYNDWVADNWSDRLGAGVDQGAG